MKIPPLRYIRRCCSLCNEQASLERSDSRSVAFTVRRWAKHSVNFVMRHLSVSDHWARRHHKPDDSLDWYTVDRRLSPTDRAERQGERGAEQLLDGGAKRHPGPLPAPQGQDEQVQGRASQAPGRTHAGKCCRLAGRPRRAARRYCTTLDARVTMTTRRHSPRTPQGMVLFRAWRWPGDSAPRILTDVRLASAAQA